MKMKKNKFSKLKPKQSEEPFEEDYLSKKWFEEIADGPQESKPVTEQALIDLKDEAKKCHDSEVAQYNIKNSKTNSDFKWMKTVMSKGTVSDKIAAHTVAIQDNPLCNLETLRNLVGMVKAGKKKEGINAMEVATEMFLSDLLRPEGKLKAFHQQPLSKINELSSGNAVTRRKLLSYWYFEDQLKETFTSFVLNINSMSHDTVEHNKEKAISCMFKLLAGNPEQEKNLLSYIVNKLGDPSQKVGSKAVYSLGQLLIKHPNMQGVVLKEVEKLLFRPNISSRAQYYGLCFLSQFYLSHETSDVAKHLIDVYFSFFRACIKKGEVDSRMMSALLTGVKRAYPYAKLELSKISEHVDVMYRIVHIGNFNTGLHALCLLFQVSDYANDVSNRFYQALYKKLVDPKMLNTTHQAMLLSLIYKALLKDQETNRIKAFVKRLLQICMFVQPSFACGILYLISQLMGKKEHIQALIAKQSSVFTIEDDNDDDEKYHDVKEEPLDNTESDNAPEVISPPINLDETVDSKPDLKVLNDSIATSWYHCHNSSSKSNTQSYDPFGRNPLYAGGDFCSYTELVALKSHFHPTVSLFATNIINGQVTRYTGDPLKDFTLIRFLERFVFKNPKKTEDVKSGVHPTFGKRKMYQPSGVKSMGVNSFNYLNGNEKDVPVDELFLYRYLQRRHKERPTRVKEEDDESDVESVQSEEFEEMLEKMGGVTEESDDDLNFMDDIGDSLKVQNKTKRKRNEEDQQESDDSDEEALSDDDDGDDGLSDEELSDMEMDDEDRDMLAGLDDDDDEEMVFDEEPLPSKKKHKKIKDDINSLFASAEEFSSLLEDEGNAKVAPGGSNTYSNKDNSSVKQMNWEDKRNRWLQGYSRAVGNSKKGKGKPQRKGAGQRHPQKKFKGKK